MIDESLLKSNFIGRDGFRWWIGQIPPEPYHTQGDGKSAWGNRFKVRILGYHPLDDKELKHEDLPWALVMLPSTAGTGGGGMAQSVRIRPGDIVLGFFMDGDDAQSPIIFGTLGSSEHWNKDGKYEFPFKPFTGFTSEIKKPDKSRSTASETNEVQNERSNQGPVCLPEDKAKYIGRASASGAIGAQVIPANTCENTTTSVVETELENLLKKFNDYQKDLDKIRTDIDKTAEVIKGSVGWLVGEIMKYINKVLVGDDSNPGIIPTSLNSIYTATYTPLAATAGPAVAHQTAATTIKSFSPAIQAVEVALVCVGNLIVEGLLSLIKDLLYAALENIENFVSCIAEQFIATLLNSIVDAIANGLSGVLGGISGLLGGLIDIVSLALEAIAFFDSLDSFDCGQNNNKCDGAKKWTVGAGPKDLKDAEASLNSVFGLVNEGLGIINSGIDIAQGVPGSISELTGGFGDLINIFNGDLLNLDGSIGDCLPVYPTSCGSAKIKIFGGGGTGAEAIPIFGPSVADALTNGVLGQNISKTSGIIGAIVTNAGSGYKFPPFVEIYDDCNLGYGAKATTVLNPDGGIGGVIITSPGDNYPTDGTNVPDGVVDGTGTGDGTGIDTGTSTVTGNNPAGVVDTNVSAGGGGYDANDTATDNNGTEYQLTVNPTNGSIISMIPINIVEATEIPKITINTETGFGAVVKPIFGFLPDTPQTEIVQVIDCIS